MMRSLLAATVFVLLASIEWGCAAQPRYNGPTVPYQPAYQRQQAPLVDDPNPAAAAAEYRRQRNLDLMLQSGTRPCTPNFTTGVCQ